MAREWPKQCCSLTCGLSAMRVASWCVRVSVDTLIIKYVKTWLRQRLRAKTSKVAPERTESKCFPDLEKIAGHNQIAL